MPMPELPPDQVEPTRLSMCDALEAIQQTMNELVWTPETLETIAEIMREAGYAIDPPQPEPCECGNIAQCYGGDGCKVAANVAYEELSGDF